MVFRIPGKSVGLKMNLRDDPKLERNWPPLTSNPSEAEIHTLCLAIQSTWDRQTRCNRAGCYASQQVEVQVVRVDEMSEVELVTF